jgi:hypothetical protein
MASTTCSAAKGLCHEIALFVSGGQNEKFSRHVFQKKKICIKTGNICMKTEKQLTLFYKKIKQLARDLKSVQWKNSTT